MFSISIQASGDQTEAGVFSFKGHDPIDEDGWKLTGTYRHSNEDENNPQVTWTLESEQLTVQNMHYRHFEGKYERTRNIVVGKTGVSSDKMRQRHTVLLSQQPAEILVHRPHPNLLRDDKYPAFWRFATKAVLSQVQRELWSWKHIRDRRTKWKRYLELSMQRKSSQKPLSHIEIMEYYATMQQLTPADLPLLEYEESRLSGMRVHVGRSCDQCGSDLIADRIVCMECISTYPRFEPIDLCNRKECREKEFVAKYLPSDKPHQTFHRFFKARKFLPTRNIGFVWTQAQAAIPKGDKAITRALKSFDTISLDTLKVHSFELNIPNGKPAGDRSTINSKPLSASGANDIRCFKPGCSKQLQSPCWFCIDCEAENLICMDCDPSGGFEYREHKRDHTLLKVSESQEEEEKEDLESVIASLKTHVNEMDKRLANMEGNIVKRLNAMEGLMTKSWAN